jgi:tripartite-type tricarboxylate transporter receptor subunit TctC
MKNPEVAKSLTARGFSSEGTTPEQFSAMIRQDVAQWAKVCRVSAGDSSRK